MTILFTLDNVPLFANKTYANAAAAKACAQGRLAFSHHSGFDYFYNAAFEPARMDYNDAYQNEQAHSPAFQAHLQDVIGVLQRFNNTQARLIEIGCGKGTFLRALEQRGYQPYGFDTAYEGTHPHIRKKYLTKDNMPFTADVFVLRHTLEHIDEPAAFLSSIAALNGGKGHIFIEVPCFDWIVAQRAFWDFTYEHCNYFTAASFRALFSECRVGNFFGGQYLWCYAPLSALKKAGVYAVDATLQTQLTATLNSRAHFKNFITQHTPLVWGAGSKGVNFLVNTQPEALRVPAVIDINPAKIGRFIAGSGQPIIAPEAALNMGAQHVLIMNQNYQDEIARMTAGWGLNLHTVEQLQH